MRRWGAAGLAVGIAVALAAQASPASAAYTMNLAAPPDPAIGKPMIIQVTGTQPPPTEWWSLAWLEVVAIPASVVPTCPASALDGGEVAASTGGRVIAIALRPNLDPSGNYANQVGYTPSASGTTLICGYTDDGAGATLATASVALNVPSAEKPANLARPRVTQVGKRLLSCSRGRWSNATGYAYGWWIDGRRIKNADTNRLVITRAARGHKVQCGVGASNAAGASAVASKSLRIR